MPASTCTAGSASTSTTHCTATSCGASRSSTSSGRRPASCSRLAHISRRRRSRTSPRLGKDVVEFNLADIFESVADAVPDREALVFGDRRLTYAELERRANRLAHHFLDVGVQPGDHIGLQLYNCMEYVEAMIACFKVRAVPVNVNYRYVEDELVYLFNDADLVAVLIDTEFSSRIDGIRSKTPLLRHVITVGEGQRPEGAVDYDDALAAADDGRGFDQRSADDLYVIYTGGTTGMPKGVMWRQEDLFFAGMGGADPVGPPGSAPGGGARRLARRGVHKQFP